MDTSSEEGRERRGSPRTSYSETAIVYLGNEQFSSRLADLSRSGLLVFPPMRQGPGTFLRLNISLPALDTVLDVDAFVVREDEKDGYYTWGVQFHELSAEAGALIDTYVKWDRNREVHSVKPDPGSISVEMEKKRTGPDFPAVEFAWDPDGGPGSQPLPETAAPPRKQAPAPVTKQAPSPAQVQPPPTTGESSSPQNEQAPASAVLEVDAAPKQSITSKFREVQAQQRREADERWQERQEKAKAEKELLDLYADALKNL